MARQQASYRNLKSVAAAALVGVGLVVLFGKLGGPTAQVDSILGCAAGGTMKLLAYIAPAAWRALQSYAFAHQGFSPCLVHMLVSCWSLLHSLAIAA